MTWYNPTTWFNQNQKANPAQSFIGMQEGTNIGTDALIAYGTAFDRLETVNRGTNMIVSACSSLDYDVKDKRASGVVVGARQKTVANLLNFTPNPYQSIVDFRTAIFTDFILEGNIFIYYDGVYLYHLPAAHVQVQADTKTFVAGYTYNGITQFGPNEVIHIKDLNSTSIYRGTSRLASADRNIKILYKMQNFQDQFFENGAIMGLILTSDNTLSQVAKDKTISGWQRSYSPKNGAKKPMILDSGLKPAVGLASSFQEMDYDTSIKTHDTKILKSLGVPPILLDGGNNANISPNLRLFYLETIIPIALKFNSAMERFFGYDMEPITATVSALQPDLKDVSDYYSSLVNTGIITANEAREQLRFELDTDPESDKLRIPANIAGSAANPSVGGAPKKPPPGGKALT
jgi:HK97 family phage portal protein